MKNSMPLFLHLYYFRKKLLDINEISKFGVKFEGKSYIHSKKLIFLKPDQLKFENVLGYPMMRDIIQ